MMLMLIPLLLCLIAFFPLNIEGIRNRTCGRINIVVTPQSRSLQISWRFTCDPHPDTIVVFRSDEKSHVRMFSELNRIDTTYEDHGIKTIAWTVPHSDSDYFPCNWGWSATGSPCIEHCLRYFVKIFHNGDFIDWDCQSIEPTWMQDFGSMRIGEMYIPGQFFAGATDAYIGTAGFYVFQDRPFYESLLLGIRYLEFDVGNHGFFNTEIYIYSKHKSPSIPLRSQLEAIAVFLGKAKKEIVVLDMDQFSYFSVSTHERLIEYLKLIFGDLLVPPDFDNHKFGPRLEDMWKANKRVIVNYRRQWVVDKYKFLWNDIYYKSAAGCADGQCIKNHICTHGNENSHKERFSTLAMTVHPSWGALLFKSLRRYSEKCNPYIATYVEECNVLESINFGSTSFIDSTTTVSQAIDENYRRLAKIKSKSNNMVRSNKIEERAVIEFSLP